MISFLFEQYGYYPDDLVKNTFIIQNWLFKLVEIEEDDQYIDKIEEYMEIIRKVFDGKGPFLIKTRFGEKISIYDNKKYVLMSVYRCNMTLKDLNKFHCAMIESDKKIDLNKLLDVWKNRMNDIEVYAISSLRVDSVYYTHNLEVVMFCLGLCQNALQYLSNIIEDYGGQLDNLTIVHKRLYDLNACEFFDPFNFIVDHPLKDLVELYKSDLISFGDLNSCLEFYKLSQKEAAIFIARMLYPASVLDLLEEKGNSVSFNFKYNIEKELQKIKKIYLYFKQVYNIRPIDWLGN